MGNVVCNCVPMTGSFKPNALTAFSLRTTDSESRANSGEKKRVSLPTTIVGFGFSAFE